MSDIDCKDTESSRMALCGCENPENCKHWEECNKYKWRRTDLIIEGWPHCQRPRDEKINA